MYNPNDLSIARQDELYSQWAASDYPGSWEAYASSVMINESRSHAARIGAIVRKLKTNR